MLSNRISQIKSRPKERNTSAELPVAASGTDGMRAVPPPLLIDSSITHHAGSLRACCVFHKECQETFSSSLTFFLQTVDEMRAQKFCPASFSKSPTDILLPLPGHAHRAPSMALREKQRTCSKRFPERAAKASRARGPTPQKSQNTREESREIECDSDLRGVALHFTWPQTPPAIGGGSSSRNATRSGPLRLARSGA